MKSQGEMHEFNETAHLVELEAEDEEEHLHEAGVICWLRKGNRFEPNVQGGTKESDEIQSFLYYRLFFGGEVHADVYLWRERCEQRRNNDEMPFGSKGQHLRLCKGRVRCRILGQDKKDLNICVSRTE